MGAWEGASESTWRRRVWRKGREQPPEAPDPLWSSAHTRLQPSPEHSSVCQPHPHRPLLLAAALQHDFLASGAQEGRAGVEG